MTCAYFNGIAAKAVSPRGGGPTFVRGCLWTIAAFSLLTWAGPLIETSHNAERYSRECAVRLIGDVAEIRKMEDEDRWRNESMFFSLCTASVCLAVSLAGLAASHPR